MLGISRRRLALGASLLFLAACTGEPSPEGKPQGGEAATQAEPAVPAPARDLAADAAALRAAASAGNTREVERLLAGGADPNDPDSELRSPLMLAAFDGHTEAVRLLLERGARVEDRDVAGRTPLMFAATGPFRETVELLIEAGADVDAQEDVESWSALMFAAGEGQVEVVAALLEGGADPSLPDQDGDTAVDHARRSGHEETARFLEAALPGH